MILNIPYWGAGVQPWNLGSAHKDFPHAPSISDQKLEVFCVYSSFHIAQMQVPKVLKLNLNASDFLVFKRSEVKTPSQST